MTNTVTERDEKFTDDSLSAVSMTYVTGFRKEKYEQLIMEGKKGLQRIIGSFFLATSNVYEKILLLVHLESVTTVSNAGTVSSIYFTVLHC